MDHGSTIPIHTAPDTAGAGAEAGCGACPHDGQDHGWATCAVQVAEAGGPAALSGPVDELQRLLLALGQRLGFPADAPERGGVRGLHLKPGEVALVLAVPPRCAGAALSNAAFETLRGLLPDTDIYITHAAP